MTTTAAPAASARPFRTRTLAILIGTGVISLIVALVLAAFADDFSSPSSAAPDGYSTSMNGHRALIEILQQLDVPVVVSRHASASKASRGVLVIAEPQLGGKDDRAKDKLRAMAHAATHVLIVLPRFVGEPDHQRPGWISSRDELPTSSVEEVLAALEISETVGRDDVTSLQVADGEVPAPAAGPLQVISAGHVERLVWSDQGTILAVTQLDDDTTAWILSDPGILDNSGLRDRDNVHFTVGLLDLIRRGGPVVFDETMHGFEEQPSLWKALFRFPLVLVSLHLLLCTVLLLWAAVGRFGPARTAPPPLPSGKDFLIRNTAALLHFGGHDAPALRRYLGTAIQHVCVDLHAPRDLPVEALRTWLERVRADRRGTVSLPDLEREVWEATTEKKEQPKRIVDLAARIHRWRTEMTHGPRAAT